jgi:glycosyltransferase involved in cell wall biosynthesis
LTLRIGLDVTSAVRQGAGIGRITRELLRALAPLDQHNQYRLLYAAPPGARTIPLPRLGPNFTTRRMPIDDIWLARVWHRAQVPLPVNWLTGPVDVFHAPDFTLPPARPGTRTLLTVHDLSFIRDPESAVPVLRAYLNRVVPRSVARADHVLADSHATRDDLIALFGAAPGKISVLYSGVSAAFQPVRDPAALATVRQRYRLGSAPFVLAVGTIQPRKNYARLIEAVACQPDPTLRLVIVGGKGWLYDAVFSQVIRSGMQDRVTFAGFAADEDLPALYSAARVVAYPSTYEGFGLPILEGCACGTPVVTSTVSCMPEVAGDAALLANPLEVDDLAAALHRAATDEALRASLIARGHTRARAFTWPRAARQLLDTYTALAAGRLPPSPPGP